MSTRKPTVSTQNNVAVRIGPGAAALLASDDPAVQSDPSRVLQEVAEELGRMTARAMLRALDDPKAGELIIGLVVLLISIIVFVGGHGSPLGCAD